LYQIYKKMNIEAPLILLDPNDTIDTYINHNDLNTFDVTLTVVRKISRSDVDNLYIVFDGIKHWEIQVLNDEEYYNNLRFVELDHPNIVKYQGVFKGVKNLHKDSNVIVTYAQYEICKKNNLFELMASLRGRNRSLEEEELKQLMVRFFTQIMDAIWYLESKNIAHTRLSPKNIYFDEHCNVKIGDFSKACLFSDHQIDIGKDSFNAPESKANNTRLEKLDIFSAGTILFTIYTRGSPFLTKSFQKYTNKIFSDKFFAELEKVYRMEFEESFRDLMRILLEPDIEKRGNRDQIILQTDFYNHKDGMNKHEINHLIDYCHLSGTNRNNKKLI
jgi:serine/threonine protein kinase